MYSLPLFAKNDTLRPHLSGKWTPFQCSINCSWTSMAMLNSQMSLAGDRGLPFVCHCAPQCQLLQPHLSPLGCNDKRSYVREDTQNPQPTDPHSSPCSSLTSSSLLHCQLQAKSVRTNGWAKWAGIGALYNRVYNGFGSTKFTSQAVGVQA